MKNKTFITKHEHQRCQVVKDTFEPLLNPENYHISDCGKFGFCLFDEFIKGSFQSSELFQHAEDLFLSLLDCYKSDYIYNHYKAANPGKPCPDNLEEAITRQEKKELKQSCDKIRKETEQKWKQLENQFLWELLMAAHDIIQENPNDDILYSPKHGYYYSSVRWHNGYYSNSSDAPINSAEDMLKYLETIWAWNDYQRYNLKYYVPDINEILKDLQANLPEEEWKKETLRRTEAMKPFREMTEHYYSSPDLH